MCGISGVIALGSDALTDLRPLAERMSDRLVRRGPDAAGVWAEDGVGLAHRRLSILDLTEAGAQPMHSACGRFVIVYNGEIYNHADLRQMLEAAGDAPVWRGHSDTETLLACVAVWGMEQTLRRAEGMFALALWDRQNRRLTLARDRMGEKPLYWGWAGGAFLFASELKALRAHPACPTELCPTALLKYLELGYVPAPYSIHPGLYKLEPGCLLDVRQEDLPAAPPAAPLRPGSRHGGLSIRRYWSLDDEIEAGCADRISDAATAEKAVETALSTAVRRQMLSDVPLGAFLSGGIDSSLIVALMQSHSSRPVRSFTIGFDQRSHDESPFAAAVAAHLGTDHAALHVTDAEAREVIPHLPEIYDEPFADSSQIPTHLVCRAARAHVTVALSGDGGDELFGGYNRHVLGPRIWRSLAVVPFPLRRILARAALALPETAWDGAGLAYNALRSAGKGIAAPGRKVHRLAARMSRIRSVDDLYRDTIGIWPDATSLLQDAGQGSAAAVSSPLRDPLPACLDRDPAARMMALDMRSYLPDDILCKVDRAAMAASLETRAPFLDPGVIALSTRLPADMKIRGTEGKWLLRQILYRHVPRTLIDRPKLGFSVPLAAWLRGPLRSWAEDLLTEESLGRDGLLDPAPIRAAWADHLQGHTDRSAQLWIVLMLQSWRNAQR